MSIENTYLFTCGRAQRESGAKPVAISELVDCGNFEYGGMSLGFLGGMDWQCEGKGERSQ